MLGLTPFLSRLLLLRRPFLLATLIITSMNTVYAQTSEASSNFEHQLAGSLTLETIIKENKRCIRCHQKERLLSKTPAITTVGAHASDQFENNCTACHGVKGDHPKNDATNNVVPFSDHASLSIWAQNQQCIECHSPDSLRAVEWTHDVHATKTTCSSCHNLHVEKDPIVGISPEFRIGLCATCHESIRKEKASGKFELGGKQ